MDQTPILGISHVALTVGDLDRSIAWYSEVLGFRPLIPHDTTDFRRLILMHPSGAVVGLTEHAGSTMAGFDPTTTCLDHLAFRVSTRDELEGWVSRLDAAGVAHAGVQESPATGSALLAFRDPDGIQLELYVQVTAPGSGPSEP